MATRCPAGFDIGLFLSCHAQCPAEFKHLQQGGGTGDIPSETCVHLRRNDRSFALTTLPMDEPTQRYTDELTRVANEAQRVRKLVEEDDTKASILRDYRTQRGALAQEYGRIQGDYANYSSTARIAKELKDVADSVTPMRPPTAPGSAIQAERNSVLMFVQKDIFFIQIALLLAVLSMVGYLVLPTDYAHSIALLLLSVAISFGFFLGR